ncbi:hypothetical protein [Lysinibacillus capsici]|uniref:hypothetical protein n=1 Tax=Lysinibacillus capsici TaxID=2115968 RepID=UPI0036C8CBFE
MAYKGKTAWGNLARSLQEKLDTPVPFEKLGQDVKGAIANSGSKIDIVNDLTTGGADKAASAETVKTLNTKVSRINNPTNLDNDYLDVYVSSSGSDSSNGLSISTPVKTIEKALSMVKSLGVRQRTIFLKEGDSFDEMLMLSNIHGSNIRIATTGNGYASVKGISFYKSSAFIDISRINAKKTGNVTDVESTGLSIVDCNNVAVNNCEISGATTGILVQNSRASLANININNSSRSTVMVVGNSQCSVFRLTGANPLADEVYFCSASVITGDEGTITAKQKVFFQSGGIISF